MEKKLVLSPSIMCADLVNLERDIKALNENGFDTLHIDVIDGMFSPSMPLGIETIKRMREVTDCNFDVHIMSQNNEFFIQEMLKIGVESITFHLESSLHLDRYIHLIKEQQTKVGIALNPATPLDSLNYILAEIDMVCLMLINPGFAGNKNETQITYATKKIRDLNELIEKRQLNTMIQVDGRVSLEKIPSLIEAGANNLVLGSTGLFIQGNTLEKNKQLLLDTIAKVKKEK